MRLTFIVIYLGFMVSARRRKPKFSSSSEDILPSILLPHVGGYLNLKGKIRREFALEAALVDHATNMICSPLSVLMPIGKLAMGAGASTEKELLKALHLSSREQLKPTFKQLIASLEYLPGVTLDMANRIYVSTKSEINKTFESSTKLVFKTSSKRISTSLPIEAAKSINRWEAALKDHATNMICSPLSVLMPIGKLAMGAGASTEKELLKALHLSSREQLKPTFKQLIASLEYLPGVTLDMANRIYVSTKSEINKTFESSTKLVFKTSSKMISTSHPIEAAKSINRWGKWMNKFDKTFSGDFFSLAATRRIPMMSRQGIYNYWKSDTLNCQIIEIPYEGLQSAMIVVLPYSNTGLGVLLRALKVAPDLLNRSLMKMEMTDVKLTMPKFKIESQLDLKDLYIKVGLRTIFDAQHSVLNGIIENEIVYVTTAIHRAIIEVNELGTEAAAASAIIIDVKFALTQRFVANHPFYFIIKVNQEQLFAGIFNGDKGFGSTMARPPSESIRVVVNHPFYFIIRVNQEQLFAGIFNRFDYYFQ